MEKTFVPFTIDGEFIPGSTEPQLFRLCYDFNELADAETLTGLNLSAAYLGGMLSVAQFRAILYAFLKTAHPLVELAEAGRLMATFEGRMTCFKAVSRLIGGEVKVVEEIEPEAPNA